MLRVQPSPKPLLALPGWEVTQNLHPTPRLSRVGLLWAATCTPGIHSSEEGGTLTLLPAPARDSGLSPPSLP